MITRSHTRRTDVVLEGWLIGHAQFWKAAIAGAPVTNLLDQYNLSDSNVGRATAMGGSPYTADWMKHFVEQSPCAMFIAGGSSGSISICPTREASDGTEAGASIY